MNPRVAQATPGRDAASSSWRDRSHCRARRRAYGTRVILGRSARSTATARMLELLGVALGLAHAFAAFEVSNAEKTRATREPALEERVTRGPPNCAPTL